MKSAAGKIPAAELEIAAAALEEACLKGNNERIRDLVTEVEDAFARLKDSSETMTPPRDTRVHVVDPGETVELERLFSLFRELGESLKEFDPVRSEACFNEIRKQLSFGMMTPEFEDLERILERQVGDYHFDEAGVTLKALDRKLKKQLGF